MKLRRRHIGLFLWLAIGGLAWEVHPAWAQEDETYSCFSLNAARDALRSGTAEEVVHTLGYITDPLAVVVDSVRDDLILIGRQNPDRPPLQLDDFVVALQSANQQGIESPGVSIDPDTTSFRKDHHVRYFGGVEGTNFGRICYEADYLMKRMSAGTEPTGVQEVVGNWDRRLERARSGDSPDYRYSLRMWFQPDSVTVAYSSDALVLYEARMVLHPDFQPVDYNPRLPLPKTLRRIKEEEERFARDVTEHYDRLSSVHPVFYELESAFKLYALANEMRRLGHLPDLSYWIGEHRIAPVQTPKRARLVKQGEAGLAYGLQHLGGIWLKVLARRIRSGDPVAYADAALRARPPGNSLRWVFRIEGKTARIDTTAAGAYADLLQAQGTYFLGRGDAERATALFEEALRHKPTEAALWRGRAEARLALGLVGDARSDVNHAMHLAADVSATWRLSAQIHQAAGDTAQALADLTQALRHDSTDAKTRLVRAALYLAAGQYAAAEADYDIVLGMDPKHATALQGKVATLIAQGREAEERTLDVNGRRLVSEPNQASEEATPPRGHLWETSLSLGANQGLNQLYQPALASLYGLGGQFAIGLTLNTAVVLGNRVRLEAGWPFEVRSSTVTAVNSSDQGVNAVGVAVGFSNLYFGGSVLASGGLWNRPSLLFSAHYVTSIHEEVFSRYWADNRGRFRVTPEHAIQVGQPQPMLVLGVQGRLALHSRLHLTGLASQTKEQGGKNRVIPRVGIGLQALRPKAEWISGWGIRGESSWVQQQGFEAQRNRQAEAFLGIRSNEIGIGIGFAQGGQLEETFRYFVFSWTVNGRLLEHKQWF